ncbi:MAG: hypothetical protein IT463_06545, partial [Planctomycetes bacterium]|nr:hypothetical protein [Planctomycetota bacterium]
LPGPRGCTGRPASGFTPQAGQLLSVEEGANGDFRNGLLAVQLLLVEEGAVGDFFKSLLVAVVHG